MVVYCALRFLPLNLALSLVRKLWVLLVVVQCWPHIVLGRFFFCFVLCCFLFWPIRRGTVWRYPQCLLQPYAASSTINQFMHLLNKNNNAKIRLTSNIGAKVTKLYTSMI